MSRSVPLREACRCLAKRRPPCTTTSTKSSTSSARQRPASKTPSVRPSRARRKPCETCDGSKSCKRAARSRTAKCIFTRPCSKSASQWKRPIDTTRHPDLVQVAWAGAGSAPGGDDFHEAVAPSPFVGAGDACAGPGAPGSRQAAVGRRPLYPCGQDAGGPARDRVHLQDREGPQELRRIRQRLPVVLL